MCSINESTNENSRATNARVKLPTWLITDDHIGLLGGWSSDGDKKEDTKINCRYSMRLQNPSTVKHGSAVFPTTPCSVRSDTPSPASPSSTCQLLPCVNCFEENASQWLSSENRDDLETREDGGGGGGRALIYYEHLKTVLWRCGISLCESDTRSFSLLMVVPRRLQDSAVYFKEDVSAKLCLVSARQGRFKLGFYWLKEIKKIEWQSWISALRAPALNLSI